MQRRPGADGFYERGLPPGKSIGGRRLVVAALTTRRPTAEFAVRGGAVTVTRVQSAP
jgi:hypothetical protein